MPSCPHLLCFNWDSSLPNSNCSLAYTLHKWPLSYSYSLGKSVTLIAFNSSLTCCLHAPSKTQLEKNTIMLGSFTLHSWPQSLMDPRAACLYFPSPLCLLFSCLLHNHIMPFSFSPLILTYAWYFCFLFHEEKRSHQNRIPQRSSPPHYSPCICTHVLCLCSFFSGWAVYAPPRATRFNLLLRR